MGEKTPIAKQEARERWGPAGPSLRPKLAALLSSASDQAVETQPQLPFAAPPVAMRENTQSQGRTLQKGALQSGV